MIATLDKLNREHGKNTVRMGMPRKVNAWELRCEHRTATLYDALGMSWPSPNPDERLPWRYRVHSDYLPTSVS
ncbi:DUF4113 domain-containing protein [Vreelandella aquamarina]|uniref:DUF4113 domain-containing protein n=1 Tax=Vreelandella aquamarina TaxID=77097 RepID=UPI003D04BF00